MAMKRRSKELMEDVCGSSAAYTWNVLPEIAKLPCAEGFERLFDIFRTAFIAYSDGLEGWVPDPSDN
jgi:hypothetical protein